MKKLLLLILLGLSLGVKAQDNYSKKYALGQNSGSKWYKLFEIDLNGNGTHNSVNISVDFNYVNTWIKYNSSTFIRLREGPDITHSDWQYNTTGIKQSVLKLKKTGVKTYELWGCSNGGWGHLSFKCSITKEAGLIINIPETPFLITDINLYEDILTKGEWYYPSGNFLIDDGNVGIGTKTPDAKLAVNGNIHTKEVKVDLTGWSDFVFEDSYKLPTLKEVEQHIKEKGHLKDIPSAKEVKTNGVFLGEMDAKLLQKIEELTLYTINQEKRIKALEAKNEKLILLAEKLLKTKVED